MKKNNWFVFIVVALLSAGVALLVAPTSGKKMRRDIKKKAMNAKVSVQTGTENLVDDFKTSYFEAVDEVDEELAALDKRQQQLRQTISSIESELTNK